MNYCTQCGHQNRAHAKFCLTCGHQLTTPSATIVTQQKSTRLLTIGIFSTLLALIVTPPLFGTIAIVLGSIVARHHPYQGYGLITAAILTLIIGSAVGMFMTGWWI
jgi:hypothetical protein